MNTTSTMTQPSSGDLHKLHLGTSSWSFPDWRGTFYPEGTASADQIRYYATQFNSVEVNTSFYALPSPSTLLQWTESVPAGFRFALKAPRSITHEKRLVACEAETRGFLEVLRSLGSVAAPGFLQFPPSFTRSGYGHRLAEYLDWLAGEREQLRLAVEVRAEDLMTEAFVRYLAERGMGFVVVERTGTPDLFELWRESLAIEGAPSYLYLRLIGDDRNKLPHDRTIQRPQDEILDKWAERIAALLDEGIHVYAYVHNPFEGHSPASVRRLWACIHHLHPLPAWAPEIVPPQDENPDQLSLF